MKVFVVITSYKEEASIGKAVEQIIVPNKDIWPLMQVIITAPDDPTLKKAEEVCHLHDFSNFNLVKDPGEGKAQALNNAVESITNSNVVNKEDGLLVMTDGDMFVSDNAIKSLLDSVLTSQEEERGVIGGVSGRPVSQDGKTSIFGYYSHIFCEAAHAKRLKDSTTPMSGYLYGVKHWDKIFPIPARMRAEDAYISNKLMEMGYRLTYAPDAMAYVKFPKNSHDWFKQKIRSLGGNVQVSRSTRSIYQDLQMILFPLTYARNFRELLWSVMLYPLRLTLWLKIYFNHLFKRYGTGMWERVESTK